MKSHGVMIDITDPATTMKNSIVILEKQKFGGTIVRPQDDTQIARLTGTVGTDKELEFLWKIRGV